MARIIKTLIQKRVSDIDMFQHVNNVSQQMYFDLGKADFYRQVLQDDEPHHHGRDRELLQRADPDGGRHLRHDYGRQSR
jgi:acyl-CoA thioesterase FadM